VLRFLTGLLAALLAGAALGANEAAPLPDEVFAQVGDATISTVDFNEYVEWRKRQKFFHGKTDAGAVGEFRRSVSQDLIDGVLLRREAMRRGGAVASTQAVAHNSPASQFPLGEQLPPVLQSLVLAGNALHEFEAQVKTITPVTEADVRGYYDANADKFTLPERVRPAVILLKVPPYAPATQWRQSIDRLREWREQIVKGTSFEELARQNSQHESAANGGDLGLVHKGMLTRELQDIVDSLKVGELAQPVAVLQGGLLVRLNERQSATQRSFVEAATRARQLLEKERGELAWQQLLLELRQNTHVVVNNRVF